MFLPLYFINQEDNIMLNATAVAAQTIAANANVLFTTTRYNSRRCSCAGGWLNYVDGSGLFTLTNRAPYPMAVQVDFNANVTADAAGAVALVLELAGEAIGGTEMDYTVVTADVYQNVGASTIITVPTGASVIVSVGNISTTAALVKDANIIIKKLA